MQELESHFATIPTPRQSAIYKTAEETSGDSFRRTAHNTKTDYAQTSASLSKFARYDDNLVSQIA